MNQHKTMTNTSWKTPEIWLWITDLILLWCTGTFSVSDKCTYMKSYYLLKAFSTVDCTLSHFICVGLFETPWTVAHQAPLSMGFSWQEYCSGLPCPPPGDLPDPGTEPESPASSALQADSLPTEPSEKPTLDQETGLNDIVTFLNILIHLKNASGHSQIS